MTANNPTQIDDDFDAVPESGDVCPPASGEPSAPFCSVIVRTQGNRRSLIDALTTLAAQTDRDLEVLLMVHHEDADVAAAIRGRVDRFDENFAAAVQVHHLVDGGRSAPLNAGLDVAAGHYVAFLDDDDIVTPQWVAEFRRLADLHPGSVVRCGCVEQRVERRDGTLLDFETVSGFEAPYPVGYDIFDSIRANRSPLCSFAVPRQLVSDLNIRFDETLRVCEDWKFQLDVVRHAGVVPSPEVTSVYRRWMGGGGSADSEDSDVWITDIQRVVRDLDTEPTLLPPGALQRLFDLYTRIELLESELGRRTPEQPPLRFTE